MYPVSNNVQISAMTRISLDLYLLTAVNLLAIDLSNFMKNLTRSNYSGIEEEFGVPPRALLSNTASVNAITEMIMPIMNTL